MRPLLLAALLLPTPALADDCADRLRALLSTDLTANGPYTALNTNRMAGTEQVFRQTFLNDSHYLVETLSPPGQPDTLHLNGGAWHSDGAGGWTLAWQIDAEEAAAGIEALRQSLANGVLSATCTTDGAQDVIIGQVGETAAFGPSLTVGYRVDTVTGQIEELTYDYTLNGLEVQAIYQISPAPGAELPLPQ